MLEIQLIRNATLRIKFGNKVLLIDPYLAPKGSLDTLAGKEKNPIVELPMPPEKVIEGVKAVLVSHLHTDHFDKLAQDLLSKDTPLYCQPDDFERISDMGFHNLHKIDNEIEWEGVKIQRTPGQHGYGEWADRLAPVSGFVFEYGEHIIYWCGDTVLYEGVKEIIANQKPNIIVTHSSGADFQGSGLIVMDAEQTVEVCSIAPKAKIIVTHMDSLDHGTITRKDIKKLAERKGISEDRLFVPEDGEIISL